MAPFALQVHERAADRAHLAQAEVYVIELGASQFLPSHGHKQQQRADLRSPTEAS
jgi:hypothetical protein